MMAESPSNSSGDSIIEEPFTSSLSHSSFEQFRKNLILTWVNISVIGTKKTQEGFFKKTREENIQILNNVTGEIKAGRLMAIMGQSGSGKTTLLAAISMRMQHNMTGRILLNGRHVSKHFLTRISGFVPQQDLTIELLTVLEHMEFMARMQMDKCYTNELRRKRVLGLINQLGLDPTKYTLLKYLSGGERRRLSLAVQLINDPLILFCDEPTTGLDSWAAASVIQHLRNLAMNGKAIICVIHQPASGIFELFDQVTLLTGGTLMFRGFVSRAMEFFEANGFPAPIGFNQAEFLLSIISSDSNAQKLCRAWSQSEQQEKLEEFHDPNFEIDEPNTKENAKYQGYSNLERAGKITQFRWLVWRSILASKREYNLWVVEFLSMMFIALLLALPYIKAGTQLDQNDIQNIQGLMYLIPCEIVFIFAYSIVNTFPNEIAVFLREVANDYYSAGPYYLSKLAMTIPKSIIVPLLYTGLIFWIVDLHGGYSKFILFVFVMIITANSANSYGIWLSASFDSIQTACLVSTPIDLISFTFSGTFLNLAGLSVYLAWVKYVSIFFYPTEAISILQWQGVQNITCDARPNIPCIRSGSEVLESRGYDNNNFDLDILGLVCIFCFFHFFGFLALYVKSKRSPVY